MNSFGILLFMSINFILGISQSFAQSKLVGYNLDGSPQFENAESGVHAGSVKGVPQIQATQKHYDNIVIGQSLMIDKAIQHVDLRALKKEMEMAYYYQKPGSYKNDEGEMLVFGAQTQFEALRASGPQIDNEQSCEPGAYGENDQGNNNNVWCHTAISKSISLASSYVIYNKLLQWGWGPTEARRQADALSHLVAGAAMTLKETTDMHISPDDIVVPDIPIPVYRDSEGDAKSAYLTVFGDGGFVLAIKFAL